MALYEPVQPLYRPNVEREHARPGAVFKELTGSRKGTITVGAGGWADFPVYGKAVAVWVQE